MQSPTRALGLLIFSTFLLASVSTATAQDDFRQQIAPVLQRRCLSCHNDIQRKGDFSLQRGAAALSSGFIEPGDADASHIVELITATDGEAAMPKGAQPLADEEVAAIRRWIEAGAQWPEEVVLEEPRVSDFSWWSYQPVVRPSPPTIEDPWIKTPVDAFVLRKLHEKDLAPSSPADRRTLIRRLTYDLIGLPPTPEEVAAFVADADADAYDKLVNRLLDSKHYGERWARHWLDVVKYADTCGYDKDKLRPNAWPYRDYVIRSLNDDKPYERFVQEQIAGDVLFPGQPDSVLGLGFIAAGPWDFIGHVEVPESKIDGKVARNLDRDDMVSNALNAFCSVTVQCARCHNHKFDPITQENYYGLQAVFAAVDRADRPYDDDPQVAQQRQHLSSRLRQLTADRATLDRELRDAAGPRLGELNQLIAKLEEAQTIRKAPEFGYHSAIADSADTTKWVEVKLAETKVLASVILQPCHDEFAGIGAGFGFPLRFKIEAADDDANWTTLVDQTDHDFPNPGLAAPRWEFANISASRIRVTATKLAERQNDYILALAELLRGGRAGLGGGQERRRGFT